MEYTGFINWGPVIALIAITDVVKINDNIVSATIEITINGQLNTLQYEPVLD